MKIADLFRALLLSLVDLFHPRILLLILVPPILALVFWIGLAWLFWSSLNSFASELFFSIDWLARSVEWVQSQWEISVVSLVSVLILTIILAPLILVTSLVVMNLVAMPVILNHMDKNYFQGLARAGRGAVSASIANAAKAFLIFALAWIVALPFWSIPPIGPLISFLAVSYLNMRIFTFDSLSEHANPQEFARLAKNHRSEFFFIAMMLSLLLPIPIVNLLIPIYGGLVFARFGLLQLSALRSIDPADIKLT